ncbi:ATP-binding cassette domain-containing protein [Marinoscillum sp. MHG1-6]|uniref:ATP-binding cassette domain-containing protein n=1 Tax=Marinoscillum sp. MHG1-6 TaxID=2959627 RepID=UPI0021573C5B|nr:ATP-binding cassette domain-containing protein [Marinoscillum sp. MHG1-6]
MSEETLSAIILLLAIVAKEDDVTLDEKASIQTFLEESLNETDAIRYMTLFIKLSSEQALDKESEKKRIIKECSKINREQTVQQKVAIILHLIILIAADGHVSEREQELLYYISEQLNVSKRVTDLVKAFVIFEDRKKIISRNILIIDNGKEEVPERCRHLAHEGMPGFLFVLLVPEVNIYLTKYIGEHDLELNGAPMRNGRIYVFPTGSVIKSTDFSPIYHSEIVNEFQTIDSDHHITFTARNISFKFPNGDLGLRDVNIEEESGKLIALMGGSGAGKSTLLNVLNGNEQPSKGSVRINGVDIHTQKSKIDGVIGYVPQDDLLIEELTVFDNLFYAAKLCFKSLNDGQLESLVTKTLQSLGLYETRNLKVGSPLEKTISGGQRKRLNIGLELLREPSVMFVDEPTSGLSSRDSENIMDLLKELSLKGKMIFVVIHQPSEEIFKMFDKLIILDVGGYQVYYGNPIGAIEYFKSIVKMVDPSKAVNPEQIFNIIESKVINEYGNFTNQRKVTPAQWNQHFKEQITIEEITETAIVPHKTLHVPNKLKQLAIFTIRDLKAKLSNKQYLFINLLEAPVLAVILAFIVKYIPHEMTDYVFRENLNIPVFFFMSVIVALFMGLTVSAEEIIKDQKILKRESFLNLSRGSYLFSKLFILFGLSAVQTLTFVLIGSFILEIHGMNLTFWMILFSVSCFANVLGLNISSAFKSAVTVYILIPLLVIPQLILSGVVVNFDKLHPNLSTRDKVPFIGEIMASRWAFEALAVHQFVYNDYEANFYGEDKIMAESEYKTIYFFPELESDLEYIHHKINGSTPEDSVHIISNLAIIKKALQRELLSIKGAEFPEIDELEIHNFKEHTYESTRAFLKKLESYYNKRYKKANELKQAFLSKYTKDENDHQKLIDFRNKCENQAIAELVKNTAAEQRFITVGDEIIQKIYPIFSEPTFPDHVFDFRAQFYVPYKHFFGALIDTSIFNVYIIWLMTVVLFVALYFDWLRKFVSLF